MLGPRQQGPYYEHALSLRDLPTDADNERIKFWGPDGLVGEFEHSKCCVEHGKMTLKMQSRVRIRQTFF